VAAVEEDEEERDGLMEEADEGVVLGAREGG